MAEAAWSNMLRRTQKFSGGKYCDLLVMSAEGTRGESGRTHFVDSGLEGLEEPSSSNILWLLFFPSP